MLRRVLLSCLLAAALAPVARSQDAASVEGQIADATKSGKVTVVHLWAPWCSNCKSELANGAWSAFIDANPDVKFVFVTVWNPTDGREILARNGVGAEKNFQLLLHPNGSRKKGEKLSSLLGMPITWIPTTWVYKDGTLFYALNYGELRFPVLQQMIADSSNPWDH